MKARGFTIVELVIVIAVIGILATIVIVAYSGVQNNANDKAVQSDLRNNADAIENFRLGSATNSYPMATQTDLQGILKFAKNAYISGQASGSVSYCRDSSNYVITGRSQSKTGFRFSSLKGLEQISVYNGNLAGQCTDGGVNTSDSGYGSIWLLKGTGNPAGAGWETWVTLN
jgi:prepilin-type N-terminal cleavage/methylation domain-containing protein